MKARSLLLLLALVLLSARGAEACPEPGGSCVTTYEDEEERQEYCATYWDGKKLNTNCYVFSDENRTPERTDAVCLGPSVPMEYPCMEYE